MTQLKRNGPLCVRTKLCTHKERATYELVCSFTTIPRSLCRTFIQQIFQTTDPSSGQLAPPGQAELPQAAPALAGQANAQPAAPAAAPAPALAATQGPPPAAAPASVAPAQVTRTS